MTPNREVRGVMADTPVAITSNRSKITRGALPRLRKEKYLVLLMFLLCTDNPEYTRMISHVRRLWIQDLLAKQSVDSLLRILIQAHRMRDSSRIQGSLKQQIQKELRTPRFLAQKTQREIRRIGVGYRDKGALRPTHKPRDEGDWFYRKDVEVILGNTDHHPTTEGDWIAAEEVLNQVAENHITNLALLSLSLDLRFECLVPPQ